MIDVCATAGKTVQGCGLLQTHFCAEIWFVLPILICFIYFHLNMVCFMLCVFFPKRSPYELDSSDIFITIMRSYSFKYMMDLLMSAAEN